MGLTNVLAHENHPRAFEARTGYEADSVRRSLGLALHIVTGPQ